MKDHEEVDSLKKIGERREQDGRGHTPFLQSLPLELWSLLNDRLYVSNVKRKR